MEANTSAMGLCLRHRIYGETFIQKIRKRRHVILVLRYLSMSGGEVVARGETAGSTVNFVPGDGLPRSPFGGSWLAMASLWGTWSHSWLLRTNLGGQTFMESDNSSCQCPVTQGRWIWGEVVQPPSPLPGILSLQVVHGTTFPLSPQGTISRDVTLLAVVDSFLECSYQFTHLPTVGMKPQCLALHPCGGQLPFQFFQPAGYALGHPCGFTSDWPHH